MTAVPDRRPAGAAIRRDQGNAWVPGRRSDRVPRLRLFCLPYAGGGASIFRGWAEDLTAAIDVRPVHLPGREGRYGEPAFTDMASLVTALTEALQDTLDVPFAFFGHSLGAAIAFETARAIIAAGGPAPCCLLVSGRGAPQLPPRRAPIHHLPDAAFIDEIRRLNGTPGEVLANAEMMELMIPLLRADFRLIETYTMLDGPRLACPVTAFGGTHDHRAGPDDLAAWEAVSDGPFRLRMLPGDHFYLHTERDLLLRALAEELWRALR